MTGAIEVVHGDVWAAFDADPKALLLHGVTYGQPAAQGFAASVLQRVGPQARLAHVPALPGEVAVVSSRILAGVSQRSYGKADARLIEEVVKRACAVARHRKASALLMPCIGAELGRLSQEDALNAIARGAVDVDVPVRVFLLVDMPPTGD